MESITELRVEFLEPKLFLIKITTCLDHTAVFCLIYLRWMSGRDVGGAVFNSRVRRWFWGFPLMVFPPHISDVLLSYVSQGWQSILSGKFMLKYYVTLRICGILAAAVSSSDQSILHFK